MSPCIPCRSPFLRQDVGLAHVHKTSHAARRARIVRTVLLVHLHAHPWTHSLTPDSRDFYSYAASPAQHTSLHLYYAFHTPIGEQAPSDITYPDTIPGRTASFLKKKKTKSQRQRGHIRVLKPNDSATSAIPGRLQEMIFSIPMPHFIAEVLYLHRTVEINWRVVGIEIILAFLAALNGVKFK